MITVFALLFLLASILLGVFITGVGMSPATHIRVGLRTLFLSYILGIILLILSVAYFS